MEQKELSVLTDQELLEEAKKLKSNSWMSAMAIGIMIGVIIYSIFVNSVGLFTLIPLFFILKIINRSKKDKALKELLQERGLA